ncbi:transcriptional regulator [Luteimicrobium album]|uniref:Transcriptional regulator n=1 Tax=Luteimicrobium album TaxID=1054550 RepID=A0ABQ6I6F4_9MICO|nr:LysR family transcriptional regulator [Luteimicrobium album]GMA25354.1 transcriptional regulator [Luteimicrobium album]
MTDLPAPSTLELLVAADSHGSISAAARTLGITQPSASAALRRLERGLGLELLVRTPRGTRLTDAGRVAAECARGVLDAYATLGSTLAALREVPGTRVRVAASLTIAEYLAPRWLATLSREPRSPREGAAPDVELVVCNSADVTRRVLDDDVALGFVESPELARGLRWALVAEDELVVVVAKDHRWATRRALGFDELLRGGLVVREEGSGTRASLERALARVRRTLPAHLPQLGSTQAVRTAVLHAGAVAVLSRLAVEDDLARGALVALPVPDLDLARPLRAVWKDGEALSAGARRLVAVAQGQSAAV